MHHHTMLALILVLLPVFLATRDYPAARRSVVSFVGQASLSAADYAPCDDRSRSQPGRDHAIGAEWQQHCADGCGSSNSSARVCNCIRRYGSLQRDC